MKPILLYNDDMYFDTNGIGILTDAISCIVTEERNGAYYLELEYPSDGIHAERIELNYLIYAYANDEKNPQAFRIVEVNKNVAGRIKATAYHISYDLNYCVVEPFNATGISDVLDGFQSNALNSMPFIFNTDIDNEEIEYNQIIPKSVRSCLGGSEGSLLKLLSGSNPPEFEWDNYEVNIWSQRGSNNGVTLRYAKNISDLNTEEESENTKGVLPFWVNTDETVVVVGDLQGSSTKVIPLDLSDQFDSAPTKYQLNQAGLEYVSASAICDPKNTLTVSFVNLADTEEYKDIAPLERVKLCDTVTVIYEPLNVRVNLKVIKTVYNTLLERYESIDLGSGKSSLGKTLAGAIDDINSVIKSNGKIVSVIQKLDTEIGEWSSTIAEIQETGIKSIKPEYALSTSKEEITLGLTYVSQTTIIGMHTFVRSELGEITWYGEMPVVPGGYYLWERDLVTWLDDSTSYENLRCLEGVSNNTHLVYYKESQIIQRANEILGRVEEETIDNLKRYSELSIKADEINQKIVDETQDLWTQVNQNTSDISNTVGAINEQGQYIE